MLCKTQGIVLRQQKIADNKRIVNVFTRKSGKKSFIVYNSYRSKKNKINLFQPFFLLNLEFNAKENSNIVSLKEATIAHLFQTIPFDPFKSSIVFFITEMVEKIIMENYADERFFDFLYNSVIMLDKHNKTANFHIAFLVAMSIYAGIMPDANYSEKNCFFDIKEGRFSSKYDKLFSMNYFISKKFNEILKCGMQRFDEVKLIQADRKILLNKIIEFYSYHFDNIKKIKSLKVLEQVFI